MDTKYHVHGQLYLGVACFETYRFVGRAIAKQIPTGVNSGIAVICPCSILVIALARPSIRT